MQALKHRVLAVDDNETNLEILKTLLADEYLVRTACCGEDALRVAERLNPDLVLLDIMMPGIDGYETCRRMRGTAGLRQAKILMVSAKAMLTERLAGYDAGADDYVTKPFDHEELLAKISVYLRLKSVEEIQEVKGRLIEVLQHSTRAPLANIMAYAELLRDGLAAVPPGRTAAVILSNARRLQQLLEKGEQLAMLRARQFPFHFERADLCTTIGEAILQTREACSRDDVELACSLPPQAIACFDRSQLHFLVSAFLENALRFSPQDGTVTLTLCELSNHWELRVADQGEGVPASQTEAVFQEFSDADVPLLNRGDGMSLAICREIITAHSGDIYVLDPDCQPQSGATFVAQVPLP